MTIDQVKNNLDAYLDFAKERGYPVFHKSNIFLRDFQYSVRDYFRSTTKHDIGSRKADEYAGEIIRFMEQKGLMTRLTEKTWLLNMEKYLLPPKVEEPKAAAPAES